MHKFSQNKKNYFFVYPFLTQSKILFIVCSALQCLVSRLTPKYIGYSPRSVRNIICMKFTISYGSILSFNSLKLYGPVCGKKNGYNLITQQIITNVILTTSELHYTSYPKTESMYINIFSKKFKDKIIYYY